MYPRLVKDAIRRSRMRDVSSPRSVSRARPGRRRAGCPEVGEVSGARRLEPGGTKPTLSTPMSPPAGKRYCETTRVRPRRSKAKIRPLCSLGAMSWQAKRPNVRGATAIPPSTRGLAWRMTLERPTLARAALLLCAEASPAELLEDLAVRALARAGREPHTADWCPRRA